MMVRIFQNLLKNSSKYRHPDRPARVHIEIQQQKAITVRVSDNGKGIPAARLQDVFSLFTRADASAQGSGIGLAMVAKMVSLHGGTIEAIAADEGATIVMTFPRDWHEL